MSAEASQALCLHFLRGLCTTIARASVPAPHRLYRWPPSGSLPQPLTCPPDWSIHMDPAPVCTRGLTVCSIQPCLWLPSTPNPHHTCLLQILSVSSTLCCLSHPVIPPFNPQHLGAFTRLRKIFTEWSLLSGISQGHGQIITIQRGLIKRSTGFSSEGRRGPT